MLFDVLFLVFFFYLFRYYLFSLFYYFFFFFWGGGGGGLKRKLKRVTLIGFRGFRQSKGLDGTEGSGRRHSTCHTFASRLCSRQKVTPPELRQCAVVRNTHRKRPKTLLSTLKPPNTLTRRAQNHVYSAPSPGSLNCQSFAVLDPKYSGLYIGPP